MSLRSYPGGPCKPRAPEGAALATVVTLSPFQRCPCSCLTSGTPRNLHHTHYHCLNGDGRPGAGPGSQA